MVWFAVHSLLMLVPAFLLGLLVGWTLWARPWVPVSAAPTDREQSSSPDEEVPRPPQANGPTRQVATEVNPERQAEARDSVLEGLLARQTPSVPQARLNGSASADDHVQVGDDTAEVAPEPEALARTRTKRWAAARTTTPGDATSGDANGPAVPHPPPAVTTAPPATDALNSGDDLTLIKGISPDLAHALAAEGFGTFAQIASASESQLRRALRLNQIRSAPRIATWADQAAALAAVATPTKEPSTDLSSAQLSSTEQPRKELSPDVEPAGPIPGVPIGRRPGSAGRTISRTTVIARGLDPARSETSPPTPATSGPTKLQPAKPPSVTVRPGSTAPRGTSAPQNGHTVAAPAAAPRAETLTTAPATPATGALQVGSSRPWSSLGDSDTSEDLERITGVNAAAAAALRAAGMTTYARIAATRDDELRAALSAAEVSEPASITTWSVQAALLLQGDEDGARTLAGGLMAGRKGT